MDPPRSKPANQHVLTVALEDYFQVGAFNQLIQRRQWHRFESRLELNAKRVLHLLDAYGVRATFFVLGWIAEKYPEMIRQVADRGHEVASKGYFHRSVNQMTREEFRDDLLRSREAIERATGKSVLGYRLADGWFHPQDLWALDVLAETNFAYDSSIALIGNRFSHEPWRRFVHRHPSHAGSIWELPISSASILGYHVPFAGGNYLRQLPTWFTYGSMRRWSENFSAPVVFYFHAWEIDHDQPRLNTPSIKSRLRHYRNLQRMEQRLRSLFEEYSFTSAARYLQLNQHAIDPENETRSQPANDRPIELSNKTPATIVIPCFNEEIALPYLSNTLDAVTETLSTSYDVRFVLVDDGSSDGTWSGMQRLFASKPSVKLIRHDRNFGVAAAIMTGIRNAETEIVCSIDCDCSYDPAELSRMIPLLTNGVSMVTASPYHPLGGVKHVPNWRLTLSRGASWLYRRILRQKLSTYTSCFRVYRRSVLERVEIEHPGFLGVTEMLGRIDLAGGTIVEYPTVLECRLLGRSKMKTIRTILGHLKLMVKLSRLRKSSKSNSSQETVQPSKDASADDCLTCPIHPSDSVNLENRNPSMDAAKEIS